MKIREQRSVSNLMLWGMGRNSMSERWWWRMHRFFAHLSVHLRRYSSKCCRLMSSHVSYILWLKPLIAIQVGAIWVLHPGIQLIASSETFSKTIEIIVDLIFSTHHIVHWVTFTVTAPRATTTTRQRRAFSIVDPSTCIACLICIDIHAYCAFIFVNVAIRQSCT